jgi:hypothetical protein
MRPGQGAHAADHNEFSPSELEANKWPASVNELLPGVSRENPKAKQEKSRILVRTELRTTASINQDWVELGERQDFAG